MAYLFKMKHLYILFIFTPIFVCSQPWHHDYAFPAWTYHLPSSIVVDYDKGFILSAVVYNFTPNFEQRNLNYKIDDNGNVIYEFTLGTGPDQNSYFEFPSLSSQGELIMAGGTFQPSVGENPMIVLLDSCRQKVWCTSLLNNITGPDFFIEGFMLADKSIIALSLQNDIDSFKPLFLHKFSSEGQPIWRKEIASMTNHPLIWNPMPSKLLLLSDGGYLVTGECYWPNPNDPYGAKYLRMFMVKADSSGNEEWLYVHGINDYVYSSAHTSVEYNGNIYTDGRLFSSGVGYPTPHFFKTSLNGTHLFDTSIVFPDYNNRRLKNSSILSQNVNGYFFSALKMYPFDEYSNDARPAMAKIDTMGTVQEFFMYDTVPPLKFIGLPFPTKDDKIIVAGGKLTSNPDITDVFASRLTTDTLTLDSIAWTSYSYDSLCPEIESHTISLDNCLIVVSNDDFKPPIKQYSLKMTPAPVPAVNNLQILYENTLLFRNITVRCYNIMGDELTAFNVNSGITESNLNVEEWPQGMYFAVAYSDNVKIGCCKIIVTK